MADLAILKELGSVWDAAADITKLANELQAKIDAIRKQYELADAEDEDLEAADDALLTIHAALADTISGLGTGQDELSTAVEASHDDLRLCAGFD